VETNQQLRRILLATLMTSIRISVLPASNLRLPSDEPPTQRVVNVYVENIPDAFGNVEGAKAITSQIFSAIRVKLVWVDFHDERRASQDGTIIVKVSAKTPIDYQPHALALSFPYEGIHAQVFYDRVRERVRPAVVPALVAHVLAHEITHLLERTNVHSDRGIMKARWDLSDYDEMARIPLTFTDLDVRLICAGLDARSKGLICRPIRTNDLRLKARILHNWPVGETWCSQGVPVG
jgi:hypothetical protein